jgi:DNA-binding transcriptional LysR family regulator
MNLAGIDLNLLLVLEALLAERSVTRAGAAIGLSQPATSNALARLRAVLDDPVLVRVKGGMRPTPRAAALAAPLRQALATLRHALAEPAAFDPASAQATITLGLTDYGALVVLPPLLRELHARAPGIRVRVRSRAGALHEALAAGELDLAIARTAPVPPRFHHQRLFGDTLCSILRARHPLARGRLTPAKFLRAEHVVVSFGEGRAPVDEVLEQRGLTRRIALYVPHFAVVPHVVLATDLVATIPERLARGFASLGGMRVVRAPFEVPGFEMSLLWHDHQHDDPAQQWLRGVLAGLFARE